MKTLTARQRRLAALRSRRYRARKRLERHPGGKSAAALRAALTHFAAMPVLQC